MTLDNSERAPPDGASVIRAAGFGKLDGLKCAPPCGAAGGRAAATETLAGDDRKHAQPGGSAEAGTAATGLFDDGE